MFVNHDSPYTGPSIHCPRGLSPRKWKNLWLVGLIFCFPLSPALGGAVWTMRLPGQIKLGACLV